jgi:hypothetical protein
MISETMDIQITLPFLLEFNVVEYDEKSPSMQIQVHAKIELFNQICEYNGISWFDCDCWTVFLDAINSVQSPEAILSDMNGVFELKISKEDKTPTLCLKIKKQSVGSKKKGMDIIITSDINDDVFSHIKKQFNEFPKWWN